MKRIIALSVFSLSFLLYAGSLCAQHRLAGRVVSNGGRPVEAVVSLYAGDSLAGATVADKKGEFAFAGLENEVYFLTVLDPDFQPVTDSLRISADVNRLYTLFPLATINLEEVTVTADRSAVVQQTATGSVFRLSAMAKNKNDVFGALTEIPELIITPERSITLSSGATPLILVNGIRAPNGISNIDPKDIESVEVIQVPSARYLGETEAVLNIKVSRKQYAYYQANLLTRQPLSGLFGYSNAGLETGSARYMVYATGEHFYFHNDESRITSLQTNANYRKSLEATGHYNAGQYNVALGGDYIFSDKDYLSYTLTYLSNPSRTDREGNGWYTAGNGAASPFRLSNYSDNTYYVNTYNVYHAHTFADRSKLESTFRFNLNGNRTSGERIEEYEDREDYRYLYDYDNFRYSSSLDVNYSFRINNHASNIGSRTNFRKDRIGLIASPVFHYREWKEYLYADFSGSLSPSISYMLSAGMDAILNHSAQASNNYFTWASSAALMYRPAPGNSMRLSYQKTNSAPDIRYLNPYNTSSDTLSRIVGNPYLLPLQRHQFLYEYTFNKRGFYLAPRLRYALVHDNVLPTGSNTGDVYTQTYVNSDRFGEADGQLTLRYSNNKWGSLGGSLGYRHTYYADVDRGSFYTSVNGDAYYRNVWVNLYLTWQRYNYTPIYVSKNFTPECELTMGWSLSSAVTLQGGLRYLLGMIGSESTTENAGYYSHSRQEMPDRYYMVTLGLSINLRNRIQKNRTEKRLYQNERGIDISTP
jgi:hypothetical protein